MHETIDIALELESGAFLQRIEEMKSGVSSLRETLDGAPESAAAFNAGAERMMTTIDALQQKAEAFSTADEATKKRIVQTVEAGVADLDAARHMYSEGGSVATTLARQWFKGLPAAMQKE